MKKLNYSLSLILILSVFSSIVHGQESELPSSEIPHKIIYQLVSGDTLSHKQLMKQMANIQKVAPGSLMEVVCHGPGLDMLVSDKSTVATQINELTKSGVVFYACEFAMKERKVEKSQILSDAGFVPAGIIEIVTKQEQGWSYIKAGF